MKQQNLEQKIVAALTADPPLSLDDTLALVAQLEAAIAEADANAEAARVAFLDPIQSPDIHAARARVEASKFVGDRLRSLVTKLQDKAREIEVAEDVREWRIDFAALAEERNALAKELEVYPKLVSQLVSLFARIRANDAALSRLHGSRPSGVKGFLLGAELIARDLTEFSRDQPSILGRDRLQLPDWTDSSRMAWPPREVPASVLLSEAVTATHDDPRRHSGDWHVVLKEDNARRILAIVLPVIATMMHDIRWLLWFALPFAVFAFWEFARTFTGSKVAISIVTLGGGIGSFLALAFLYLQLAPPPEIPLTLPPEPERFSKLQYSKILVRDNEIPIKLDIWFTNAGNLPAVGIIHSEFPQITERPLLDAEIDVQFAAMQASSKVLERQGVDTELQPGDPFWWTMNRSYSVEEFKRVTDGPSFLYVMVRAQYKDRGLPKGKWRITEICQFIFKNNAPHLCPHHNRIYISD